MGKGKKGGGVRLVQKKQPNMKDLMQNPMDALQIPPEEMVNLPPKPDRSYQIVWPIRKFNLHCTCWVLCSGGYVAFEVVDIGAAS